MKVSLFLSGGVQLADGTIIISMGGHGPPGTRAPGKVNCYSSSGTVSASLDLLTPLTPIFAVNPESSRFIEHSTLLGLNLYDDATRERVMQALQQLRDLTPSEFKVNTQSANRVPEVDANRRQVAMWELDSLASMISTQDGKSEQEI